MTMVQKGWATKNECWKRVTFRKKVHFLIQTKDLLRSPRVHFYLAWFFDLKRLHYYAHDIKKVDISHLELSLLMYDYV